MQFIRATAIKKEDSIANFISLQMLEAPSCAVLNVFPIRVQHNVQILSVERLPHFGVLSC